MLLAFKDKTLSVEEPKTITWIYDSRVYKLLSNSKNPNKFFNNINFD